MDFRELEVFRAVAEDLHFGRAAERLYVTQSAVSQQLRRLEDELGVLLFHRTSRTVRLTPAGTALLAEVRKIFAARDHAIQVAQQAAAGERGRLSIAANYPASRLLLLPLIERLRASHPSLTLIPRELPSSEQMAELLRGELDVGLAYGPIANASLCSAKLLEVPVVAVVRSSHPLAGSDVLGLSDLPRHRYITAHAGATSAIEDSLMARAAVAGIRLRRSPSATDLSGYLLELETSDTIGFSSLPRGEQSRANGMHVGETLAVGEVSLRIEQLRHVAPNCGVRLADAHSSLVYTGDTGVTDELVDLASGAGTLLAESTLRDTDASGHGHLSSSDAAHAADDAGVTELVLTHFSSPDPVQHRWHRDRAASVFDGPVGIARPGISHPVAAPRKVLA